MPPRDDPCPDVPRLQEFLLGLLPAGELDRVEGHLNGCPACLERLACVSAADDVTEGVALAVRAGPRVQEAQEQCLLRRMRDLRTPTGAACSDTLEVDVTPLQIPGYDMIGPVGGGGMGVVYKAVHRGLGRVVAVKLLRGVGAADPTTRGRFLTEARILAGMRHPNVVQVFDVGEHEGRPYFSMEYLEGGSLAELLHPGPLPGREAARLVEPLARAMHHAHEQGVVHRDLKPANVLLQRANHRGTESTEKNEDYPSMYSSVPSVALWSVSALPKIADFGLARRTSGDDGRTRAGAVLGTPSYMAPEQAEGCEAGPAADVYGLGAVLYECLAGRPPFRGTSALDTLDQVRRLDPVPSRQVRRDVPPEVDIICLKCLEKDPRRRYASALELADDLRRFLDGEPIRARPAGPAERLVKWARRKPAAAALTLACGVFALLAMLGAGWHHVSVTAALKRAEEGETRARERGARVARQYREATATIRRIMEHLAEKKAHEIPQLHETQRAQLESALAFFEQAAREQDQLAPEASRDLALLSAMAGHYQLHTGHRAAAEKNLVRAIELLTPTASEHPTDHEARATLACCHTHLSAIRTAARQWDQARPLLTRAVEILEALIRDDPTDPRHKDRLAEAYHNLGNLCLVTREPATSWYEKAMAITRERVRTNPGDIGHRISLAEHSINLWQAYGRANRKEDALATLRDAIATLEPLAREHPGIARIGVALGDAHVNLGATWLTWGKLPDALEEYTRGLGEYQRVLKHEPNYAAARNHLLPAHGGRAQCLTAMERYSEAVPDWDRVVELADTGSRPQYRLRRALLLVRLGEYEKAARDADEVAGEAKGNGTLLYNAACVLALCAAGEPARREGQAGRAVALLEGARKAGHFKKPENVAHMKKDPDLDSLRGRADYQALLRAVE